MPLISTKIGPGVSKEIISAADLHIAFLLENGETNIDNGTVGQKFLKDLRHAIITRLYSEHKIPCIIIAGDPDAFVIPITTRTVFHDWKSSFKICEPTPKDHLKS